MQDSHGVSPRRFVVLNEATVRQRYRALVVLPFYVTYLVFVLKGMLLAFYVVPFQREKHLMFVERQRGLRDIDNRAGTDHCLWYVCVRVPQRTICL